MMSEDQSSDAGQAPPTVPCGTLGQRLRASRRIAKANAKMLELATQFDQDLNEALNLAAHGRRMLFVAVGGDIDQAAIDQGAGHGDIRQIARDGVVAGSERSVDLAMGQAVRRG